MNQFATILNAFDLLLDSHLWADKKPSEVLNILMYVHTKGWLYTPMVEGKIKAVMCAYRIKEGDSLTKLPEKEEGDILYIPFVLSVDEEENLFEIVRESMRVYLEKNPDITEIVLEDKNHQIKKYKLKDRHGKEQTAGTSSNAHVPNRPHIQAGI